MKGVIFNLFEEFISHFWGEETLEEVYEKVEFSGDVPPFVGPLTYPDKDMLGMLHYLSNKTADSIEDLLFKFGCYVIPRLAERYPFYFEKVKSAKEFLEGIGEIHFIELKKLYEDVTPPHMCFEENQSGSVFLHYQSQRKMCALLEGAIKGVGERFGETISSKHIQCMKNGADKCILELHFN